MIKVAPSILAADYSRLGDEVADAVRCGADYIHFDVMDGVFVNNITGGIPMLTSLRRVTDAFLDVHLMVERPVRYAAAFCEAGADLVNFHVEADDTDNILKALSIVRSYGKKTGITLCPGTPAEAIIPFIGSIDLVLVMTVVPGQGGQTFMPEQLQVIHGVRNILESRGVHCEVEVDGGIILETAVEAVRAGADVLVSGSTIFHAQNRAKVIDDLKHIH